MSAGSPSVPGVPSPAEWLKAQSITTAGLETNPLYTGVVIADGATGTRKCRVAGANRARVHFKATRGGSLTLQFMNPDGTVVYTIPAITASTVVANTEISIETDQIFGEAYLLVSYVPTAGASGTVSLFDFNCL